ncbi:MAG: NADPH-dependent FMN reductase [Flavobacteriia bacterium]|jgi:chromate reductase
MKILAFGASYSSTSINKQFATFAAKQFSGNEIEILDLNHFDIPIFTVDREAKEGHPNLVKEFVSKIESADLLIISMAEHNGSYTAAFKNLFDWASRVKAKTFENKNMLLLSTSDGGRGGVSALTAASDRFPRHGANILASFSLPHFNEYFNVEKGILNEELRIKFEEFVEEIKNKL